MEPAWMEVWSVGSGRSRTYCGIARTEEGFAVDVFHQDTCIEASVFATSDEARKAAAECRFRYHTIESARLAASSVVRESVGDLTSMLSAEMPACGAR